MIIAPAYAPIDSARLRMETVSPSGWRVSSLRLAFCTYGRTFRNVVEGSQHDIDAQQSVTQYAATAVSSLFESEEEKFAVSTILAQIQCNTHTHNVKPYHSLSAPFEGATPCQESQFCHNSGVVRMSVRDCSH